MADMEENTASYTDSYYDRPINFLKLLGLHPGCRKFQRFAVAYLVRPLLISLYALVIYQLKTDRSQNSLYKIDLCESMVALGYNSIRTFTFLHYDVLIKDILDTRALFWKDDFAMRSKTEKEFAFYERLSSILLVSGMVSLVFMCLPFFIISNAMMPLAIFTPDNSYGITLLIWFAEAFILLDIVLLMVSYDVLFVYLCLDLTDQFRRLISTIQSIEFAKDEDVVIWHKLKRCVEHQNLLMSIRNKMIKAYSIFLFCQYFLSIGENCVIIFGMMTWYNQPALAVRYIAILICAIMLTSFIFLPACALAEEAEKVPVAVYNIDFHNSRNNRINKDLVFILQGSQQSLEMYGGGGMLKLNKVQYLQLFRLIYSISAILATFRQ